MFDLSEIKQRVTASDEGVFISHEDWEALISKIENIDTFHAHEDRELGRVVKISESPEDDCLITYQSFAPAATVDELERLVSEAEYSGDWKIEYHEFLHCWVANKTNSDPNLGLAWNEDENLWYHI